MKIKYLFGMAAFAMMLAACNNVDNPLESIISSTPASPTTTTITLNLEGNIFYNDKMFFLPGDAATSIATITEGAPVTITSSDESVIRIDENGNIVPVGPGTATITITVTENEEYTGASETVTIVVGRKVSLADETGDEFVAQNGDQITGIAPNTMHLTIPDGALVRLKDATIKPTDGTATAAIVCEGDATLILEGANNANGMEQKAGVQVGPEGKTLTIDGTGSLEAQCVITSAANYLKYSAAGIGSSENESCGCIIINNGTITAKGGSGSAIGSGKKGSCQDILINGGTIRAEVVNAQNSTGAGIGAGVSGSCGNITITGGDVKATTNTTSTIGQPYAAGIGASGGQSSCGDITISGGIVHAESVLLGTSGATGGGAGIGCGYKSSTDTQVCGNITISGGNVKAYASKNASGIGTGHSIGTGYVNIGNINITGGKVYARKSGSTASLADIWRGTLSVVEGTVYVDPNVTWNGTKGYTPSGTGYNRVP